MKHLPVKFSMLFISFLSVTNAQVVSTLAGNESYSCDGTGATASFSGPASVAADGLGNLYVADQMNNEIRKIVISTGMVTTFAGSTNAGWIDATGTAAKFNQPVGIAYDGTGNLFVADKNNHSIRKIVIATGTVTTLCGAGTAGSTDGTGFSAKFNNPYGVAPDGTGNLYVADAGNNEIRKVIIATGAVTTFAGSTKSGFVNATDTAARFKFPGSIVCDGSGNLYVGDISNYKIRKIVISSALVSTLAGSGTFGAADGTGAAASFGLPGNMALDGSGNLYVEDQINNEIRQVVVSSAVVTTIAGATTSGYVDGTGTSARFDSPTGVALDGSGNLFITDGNNNEIRQLVIATAAVTTLAGASPYSNGTGAAARFLQPFGVAADANGNLFVSDNYSMDIRQIVISSGVVTTLAGSIVSGAADGTGASASFNHPSGMVCDGNGNLFVADLNNNVIRKIVIATGVVTTFAGTGAGFNKPTGITTDGLGSLYVADTYNHSIRKIVISSGVVTLVAGGNFGNTDGIGSAAKFEFPTGVASDGAGNLYVADSHNNEIRKIVLSSGAVSTFAGGLTAGSANGTGTSASFSLPTGITSDGLGNLYVADQNNNQIRKISLSSALVSDYAGSTPSGYLDGTGTSARFHLPTGVTSDAGGNVYVADNNNNVIRAIAQTVTGIENHIASTSVSLYPDPAANSLNLSLVSEGTAAGTLIKIIDLNGKELIKQVTLTGNKLETIDVSRLTPGMYLVQIINEKGIQSSRFMKQ